MRQNSHTALQFPEIAQLSGHFAQSFMIILCLPVNKHAGTLLSVYIALTKHIQDPLSSSVKFSAT